MEAEGKVHRGVVDGARKAVFMLEADSNEEVNQILQGLPAWGILKVEVTPLLSFETRREHEQQALEQLEASLQQQQ
jgi:muconolactone delta-isomerase